MKKVFVTGSTGLLGNNLVRLLVEQCCIQLTPCERNEI